MRMVVPIVAGVSAAVIVAIPLAWLGHGLSVETSWIALLIGLAVLLVVFRALPQEPPFGAISAVGWLAIIIYACASARAFFWLIYPAGDEWRILSPNNLGDLALHMSFIRWLALVPHWWPASPILAGDALRYPLGSDLFNALLLRAGMPLEQGLIWCGIIGAAITGIALWRWGKAVAIAALLFNDGLGRLFLTKEAGVDPENILQWKNLFLTLFVTQRGFLFALPAGLILLASWREEFFGSGKKTLPFSVQVLLLAAVPIFSVHTALFLGVAMTGLWVMASGARNALGRLASVAWPPMAFFGWLVTTGAGGTPATGTLGLAPGWMSDGTLGFWFWNFGIVLPLSMVLCVLLVRREASPEARAFVWPAAAVFAACMVIRFAPWPWDNTKLMLWSWLVTTPYVWKEFFAQRTVVMRAAGLLLLFGAGVLTLSGGLDGRHGYGLLKRGEIEQAAFLLRDIPPDAVVACSPEYNQPVLMLGHPVVCGYEGHLWSHGLDYKGRLELLNGIMNGEAGWREKARSLGVSYIYWSDLEAKRWPDSRLPWAKEMNPSLHPLE